MDDTTRRYCPEGHIFQTKPTFEPCCSKAQLPAAERTHCPKGHPYTKKNTRSYNGKRYCRTCQRARSRKKGKARPNQRRRDQIRSFITLRDRGHCRYCGAPGREIDHVQPKANGENNAFDNLVLACTDCNQKKGDKEGFDMRNGRLYWQDQLIDINHLFGDSLWLLVWAGS